jgi:hypothetical protein
VRYPLEYDGRWIPDLSAAAHLCTSRTRAVVMVQPNNPTGSFMTAAELAVLGELCASRGIALVSDEVFSAFPFDSEPYTMPSALDLEGGLTFVLGGLSKAAGLPQMKLSWIVAGGGSHVVEQSLARLEVIGDTFLSVNTPVQASLESSSAGSAVRRTYGGESKRTGPGSWGSTRPVPSGNPSTRREVGRSSFEFPGSRRTRNGPCTCWRGTGYWCIRGTSSTLRQTGTSC